MKLSELKKVLDEMLEKAKWEFEDDEWYEPLRKLGVLGEYDRIIDDDYYDAQAVAFARKLLDLLEEKGNE